MGKLEAVAEQNSSAAKAFGNQFLSFFGLSAIHIGVVSLFMVRFVALSMVVFSSNKETLTRFTETNLLAYSSSSSRVIIATSFPINTVVIVVQLLVEFDVINMTHFDTFGLQVLLVIICNQ
ncbi:uncharacterized protein LOC130715762 [Lotus japonicus]|uniref:uncharacterized protein LOC130715762 n=1 Tax=Lotus japonicus TaxID=34305 RepID=UPI0025902BDA|nr:uncharacterized protein LOC130715762 [Lotus japonicus]